MTKYPFITTIFLLLFTGTVANAANFPTFINTPSLNKQKPLTAFLNIRATIEQEKVFVNWSVSGNEDVDQFIIESTKDGVNYVVTAFVFGTDSTENSEYKFFEKKKGKIKTFRIKLITKKGAVVYSQEFVPVAK